MPEQDPRQAAPRPRPGGTASTGQHPVARTRDTPAGPSGTARIPVVRQTPPGPAAPRPGQRQPEGQRPSTQPPPRSRLRTPPPAPPRQPPTALRPAPAPVAPLPQQRPTPTPTPTRPFSQLAPAPTPLPPTPTEFIHTPAPAGQRRHGAKGFLAALAVFALGVLWGLPAFASEALDAPPVAGIALDGVQRLQVGTDVEAGGATTDSVTGSMPVAAAPSWVKPVQGRLGDAWGPRPEQPVPGVNLFHRGQDIVAPCGRQIHAAAAGTVTAATYWGTYGNWILVEHGDGVAVGYAHESQMFVSVGQHVSAGQVIGLVGETGAATGCHLHLEVHLNGVAVNPVPFFVSKHIPLG
jgi:murein DD-endopeptidase MepM/ murein hydrolase activator NlpD